MKSLSERKSARAARREGEETVTDENSEYVNSTHRLPELLADSAQVDSNVANSRLQEEAEKLATIADSAKARGKVEKRAALNEPAADTNSEVKSQGLQPPIDEKAGNGAGTAVKWKTGK
jgi:hypothetical protein